MRNQQWTKDGENSRNILAWQLTKVTTKTEVIDEARQNRAFRVVNGHLSSQEVGVGTQNFKNTKAELYSEVTLSRDDSGSYAVFREQGSSASQMTAVKVMDATARLPGCSGQAADAVSTYTQVKMEDAHRYWKYQSQNVQIFVDQNTNDPKSWSSMEDPSRSSQAKSVRVIFWQDFSGTGNT